MESVHLRLPDGTVATGFEAWRGILRELPGWRWLAVAAGLPLLGRLGPVIYALVARNRRRVPGSEGPPPVHGHRRPEGPVG
jgi:predicted DCC family thiol-disulfide oxidoreductase YuxK